MNYQARETIQLVDYVLAGPIGYTIQNPTLKASCEEVLVLSPDQKASAAYEIAYNPKEIVDNGI